MNKQQTKQDIVLGIGSVIFGIIVLILAKTYASTVNAGIEGTFMPIFVATVTILAGIGMTIMGIHSLKKFSKEDKGETLPPIISKRVVILTVMITFYFVCVAYVGYVFSSFFALIIIIRFFGYNNMKIILPVALITPILVWVLFTQFAGIPMPETIFI